jgi:hypothetical protein
LPHVAEAAERPIVVGEVTSGVVRSDLVDLRGFLRDAAERELAALPVRRSRSRERVIVSVRLASLEATTASTTCSVTLALRYAKTGALFAMLEGRARVDDPTLVGQRVAMVGALRSALSRMKDALGG